MSEATGDEINREANLALEQLRGSFAVLAKHTRRAIESGRSDRVPVIMACQLAALGAMLDHMTASMPIPQELVPVVVRLRATMALRMLDAAADAQAAAEAEQAAKAARKLGLVPPS